MSFRRSGDAMTWTFDKSDIGGSAAIAFFGWSSTWDASDNKTGGEDFAPDYGTWTYDGASGRSPTTTTTPSTPPAPTKVAVLIDAPKTAPCPSGRGEAADGVSVKINATEKDTGKTVTATKIAGFRVR
ncbi:MAG: hypothetical protein ACM3QU_02310 [Verrucomicrobiota bacterium]